MPNHTIYLPILVVDGITAAAASMSLLTLQSCHNSTLPFGQPGGPGLSQREKGPEAGLLIRRSGRTHMPGTWTYYRAILLVCPGCGSSKRTVNHVGRVAGIPPTLPGGRTVMPCGLIRQ